MGGRPRKRLVTWAELVGWLRGEGVTAWDLKVRLVGEGAPAWRYPKPFPGYRKRRLYDSWAVAAWLKNQKPRGPQGRHPKTGQFLCKS